MDYLPYFLKKYELDLQPTNSICIDVNEARNVLYPGAHIAASNPYEHYHHGIVVDVDTPDLKIIHFWGQEKDESRVQFTNLPVFLAGSPLDLGKKTRRLYLVNYDGDSLEKQQETVKRAKETLEKTDELVYNLATLNCEGFANFCRAGSWESEQINRSKDFLVSNALQIYERVKNANEQNKKHIHDILKSLPQDALTEEEQVLYNKLCQYLEN